MYFCGCIFQSETLKMKQWLKSFVHNCVVHPAMPFLPVKVANWLHDKNANWAFGLERYDELALEGKKSELTPQEAKEWQVYLDLMHYQAKDSEKITTCVRIPEDAILTGRKMLTFIEEALQKNPATQYPNSPKDSDSDLEPTP